MRQLKLIDANENAISQHTFKKTLNLQRIILIFSASVFAAELLIATVYIIGLFR